MKDDRKSKPPLLANWLASKFINEALLEEFFGDLKEIYEERIATRGKFYAKCMYWIDTLHLMIGFTSFNLFKTQNNPTIMSKHYLIISIRNLSRNKAYSIINILGLAVGMGVCLTIFQYVYFELSHDRFHNNFENTFRITLDENKNGMDNLRATTTFALGPSAKETIPEIKEYVRIHRQDDATVINPDKNEPFKELARDMLFVDKTFLQVFNFPLKLGSKESVFDNKFNIVITEKTARKYFGTDNPIGKTLKVGGEFSPGDFIVSGVLEELPINSHLQFEFLLPLEHLLEFANFGMFKNSDGWSRNYFMTYVIIDESANLDLVREKLDQLIVKYKGKRNSNKNVVEKVGLQPLSDIYLNSDVYSRSGYVINKGDVQNIQFFSIIAVFILFIAWVNYINLSTARSMYRAKEVGVRKSIGAFRRQLISQFMIESVLLNLIAALLSIGIAFSTLPVLSQIIGKELEMNVLEIPLFWAGFSVVIIFGALLSGSYPAFVLSAFKPVSMLGANKTVRAGKISLRKGLITFQFLISLLLISGTYLVYKQITYMKNQELGLDMEKILVLDGFDKLMDSTGIATIQAFKTEVTRHSSISSVATSAKIPGKGYHQEVSIRKVGAPESENKNSSVFWQYIGIDFPETYDFEFVAGSSFTQDQSNRNDGLGLIINEEAVRVYGLVSPEKAIQEKLIISGKPRAIRIVGVVKDFHWHSLREAYTPYLFGFNPRRVNHISLKINLSNIQESIAYIKSTYKAFFPDNAFEYFFLEDEFNKQYQADVQFGNLFLAFTALAIFIACIGLFALVSYSATLRIKEIGIRKVLGASIGNLMILLSKEYFTLLLIAAILAAPAIIYWGGSWLENYAFRINMGIDLLMIPTLTLLFISLLTVSHRTYSTAKTNPVDSLRKE
ncbi:ABC transporter permease [Fulvivirgaceae bacterium BMA12]|uniref:ABC transporter permease n=1 Tax=Agaribacillus aureus TaxID=3051825 RepID=A0ABT8L0R0_9BACT|nr:ABC transporter permease [Fulvivirgaceae bacterium BMA12]